MIVAAEPLQGDPVMGLRSLEDGYTPPILDIGELDRKVLVHLAVSDPVAFGKIADKTGRAGDEVDGIVHRAMASAAASAAFCSCTQLK